ncbi:Uncharacterized protein FWK35_00029453, partial [Aphis craccivora]
MIPKPDKSPDLPSSYRPITLLPFLGKLLERLILKRLLPYISTNNILPDSQFGFRSAHSTIHHIHKSSVSIIEKILFGVPQGGILSPILFNIYTSDQHITQNTSLADYSDDKAIISIDKNPLTASENFQTHLNLISQWYTDWRIKPNPN